jgi:hypothetical protein
MTLYDLTIARLSPSSVSFSPLLSSNHSDHLPHPSTPQTHFCLNTLTLFPLPVMFFLMVLMWLVVLDFSCQGKYHLLREAILDSPKHSTCSITVTALFQSSRSEISYLIFCLSHHPP